MDQLSNYQPGRDETSSAIVATQGSVPGIINRLLVSADVKIDGGRPWDIKVRDPAVYKRVLARGSVGFGEAYMDGLWDSDRLDETFTRLLAVDIDTRILKLMRLRVLAATAFNYFSHKFASLQSRYRAFEVGERHYDIGNDVYQAMLDSRMNYSCGYWQDADNLEQAQRNKLDLICRKLDLKPGEKLLDIGCGWGSMAQYAAQHYGVEVTGITISKNQQQLAQERCRGLPVNIKLLDYRDLSGTFDKVVSIGMFEHVGARNYKAFFDVVRRVMSDEGLFLLHTIGDYYTSDTTDPWINKYIFPNGHLPSAQRIARAIEPRLIMRDWHNFGPDYDRTIRAWWHNFDNAWPDLKQNYDERFYRMWKYYLHCCMGLFRSGQGQLWQIVFSRRSARLDYRSVREL
jgi:cyclopropane-fatty-acyl-phospholipid synthase